LATRSRVRKPPKCKRDLREASRLGFVQPGLNLAPLEDLRRPGSGMP
jgi:hypothetical protein